MTQTATDTAGRPRPGAVPQNGPAIRSLREKDGYTQTEFAAACQITQGTLGNIEAERRTTSVRVLNVIARKLGVPVAAILRDPQDAAGEAA